MKCSRHALAVKHRVLVWQLVFVLAVMSGYSSGQEVAAGAGEYKVPPRRFRHMMPQDIEKGEMAFVVPVTEEELVGGRFAARLQSGWGRYTYEFNRLPTVASDSEMALSRSRYNARGARHCLDVSYAEPDLPDDRIVLQGKVVSADDQGGEVTAVFPFSDQVVTFSMKLTERQDLEPIAFARNVRYGPHDRHVFDVYKPTAETGGPTPVVVRIHGGGWTGGDKRALQEAEPLLARGIAYASINYRLMQHARAEGVYPRHKAHLMDAARAIQTLRYRADKYNIDKTRVGLIGGSAGGYTALWLGLHDDLADPGSDDPIARESTKPQCVAGTVPMCQFTPWLDLQDVPKEYRTVAEEYQKQNLGFHASQFTTTPEEVQDAAPGSELRRLIDEYNPNSQVTPDDPALLLDYLYFNQFPVTAMPTGVNAHRPINGVPIQLAYRKLNLECHLLGVGLPVPEKYYPAAKGDTISADEDDGGRYKKGEGIVAFFCDKLLDDDAE
jgi:acetyl esterase/lipase